MQDFRTTIPDTRANFTIDFTDKIWLIGSCFSDNIGAILQQHKFDVVSNPFGILYNPISIFKSLETILTNQEILEESIGEQNGIWHSWNHHSLYNQSTKESLLTSIQNNVRENHTAIQKCTTLVITFGTAWVYEYQNRVVANCHKVPNNQFQKRLLSVAEITAKFTQLLPLLERLPNSVNVLFTLSPVRHIKDGFEENQISKATLLLAINELKKMGYDYFPSYEIMLDDLRDYRFYKKDMLHPSQVAVDYIWKHFQSTYFAKITQEKIAVIAGFIKNLNHRPRQASSDQHQKFLHQLLNNLATFQQEENIDFSKEVETIKLQLSI